MLYNTIILYNIFNGNLKSRFPKLNIIIFGYRKGSYYNFIGKNNEGPYSIGE